MGHPAVTRKIRDRGKESCMIFVFILVLIFLLLLPLYACIRVSAPFERAADDAQQMDFLREYRESREK